MDVISEFFGGIREAFLWLSIFGVVPFSKIIDDLPDLDIFSLTIYAQKGLKLNRAQRGEVRIYAVLI